MTIRGKLFDSHAAEATLSASDPLLRRIDKLISLSQLVHAKPVRTFLFPRYIIRFEVTASQADLWSGDNHTLLVRSLATGFDATEDTEHRTDNCFFENIARAVFWTAEGYRGQGKRRLQGEIDVKSLKPITLFPRATISVRQ